MRFLFASFLKKSILDLLKEIVILTLFSFATNCSGGGRKSLITLSLPIGSSVYFILLFINLSPFSPVSGTIDTDNIAPVGESNSDDTVVNPAHTVESILTGAMTDIFCNHAVRIKKRTLGYTKRHPMLPLIFSIFSLIPFEANLFHSIIIRRQE